jgi:hypothetical protein
MPFEPRILELLERLEEIEIETRAHDGTVHRTIVWVVADSGDAFVRSVRGAAARWYREATADPSVAIHANGERIPALAVRAADARSVARASAALERKYAADPSMPPMLREEVLGTTLRLEPS